MPDYVKIAGEMRGRSMETALPELKGFDQYYDNEMKPLLAALEAERPQALRSFYRYVAGAIVLFGIGAVIILTQNIGKSDHLIIIGMACVGIMYWGYQPLAALREKAKLTVMEHLCDYLGLDYHIHPQNVSLGLHRELSLIPSYDESKLEDQITGKVGHVDFDLFEAKLVTITRDSKGRTRRHTVFRGLLAAFDFHKNFTGTTLITRDYSSFGNFFDKWGKVGERVRLEDPTFENMFEVYSTDQVEARYLLTPTFMERICRLSLQVGKGNLQLAFHQGNLLMSIRKNNNSFEGGSAFSNLADQSRTREIIHEVALIYDIVNKLKLDMATMV